MYSNFLVKKGTQVQNPFIFDELFERSFKFKDNDILIDVIWSQQLFYLEFRLKDDFKKFLALN